MSDKPSFPLALAYLIDALNSWFGKACAWLTVFLVIGTAVVVVLRYGFGIGATALQEAVLYAHALMFMGAAAWVLQRNGHVRVDIFYQKFSGRRQALVEIFGNLLFLLPVALFLGSVQRIWRPQVRLPAEKHHPGTGRQPGTARYFQSDQGNLRLQRSPASSGGETWLS